MEEIFSVIPDDYFGPDDGKKGEKEEDHKNIIKDVVNVVNSITKKDPKEEKKRRRICSWYNQCALQAIL